MNEILAVNKSVQTTLRDLIQKEILLEFKFENILEYLKAQKPGKELCKED